MEVYANVKCLGEIVVMLGIVVLHIPVLSDATPGAAAAATPGAAAA